MAEQTDISWCDATWSPWEGCTQVSPACDNCYAKAMNQRFRKGANWGAGAPRHEYGDAHWKKPLLWNAKARASGRRMTVFPSVCDPFDNEVPESLRARFWRLIVDTPHLTWLLLTKRIGNARSLLPPAWWTCAWPANVWLGATVVTQEEADRDVPKLLAVPARLRFLSIEPMLGEIRLRNLRIGRNTPLHEAEVLSARHDHIDALHPAHRARIDWVICGGESGPRARPMHPDWVRSLRDECAESGVPFHLKQHGEWGVASSEPINPESLRRPGNLCRIQTPGQPDRFEAVSFDGSTRYRLHRYGRSITGCLLDGIEHKGFPA